jgi:hypothetical protein
MAMTARRSAPCKCAIGVKARALLFVEAMLFFVRPSVIGSILVVCGAVLGVRHAVTETDARFQAARERAIADCKAYRASQDHSDANVCKDDPFSRPVIPAFKKAEAKIEGARARIHTDPDGAAKELRSAFEDATKIDRHGTLLAALVSAKIVNEGLDVLEKNESAFTPRARIELVSYVRLGSTKHPFEAERLTRLWVLSERNPLAERGVVGEAIVTDAMLQEDAILSEMDRAIAVGDVARCERAARGRRGLLRQGLDSAPLCKKAADVAKVDDRVLGVVTRAIKDIGLPTPPPRA